MCLAQHTGLLLDIERIEMDKINHPEHYNQGDIECIDVIELLDLNFNLGNALKYIWRCDIKGSKKDDLKKAIWYLERELKPVKEGLNGQK